MIDLPRLGEIEQIVFQTAINRFGPLARSTKKLAAAIKDLSDFYITDPSLRKKCPNTLTHKAARLLFFTLADMPKAYVVAAESQKLVGFTKKSSIKILDLGVGYGAQSLGLIAYFSNQYPDQRIHLDVLDQDSQALETVGELLTNFKNSSIMPDVDYTLSRANLEKPYNLQGNYDFIIIGNTLCELKTQSHYALILKLLSKLSPDGLLYIIEPALRKTTRNLHHIRDQLLEESRCHVIAPCTRTASCPCLVNAEDWCHESRTYLPPPICRQLSAATGLRRIKLKWSYLTLSRQALDKKEQATAWRVVSEVTKQNGRYEVLLCGAQGLYKTVLPKKAKTRDNEVLKKLDRGALVWIQNASIKGEQLVLSNSSSVTCEEP